MVMNQTWVKEKKSQPKLLIMEHSTRVNGWSALRSNREEVCKFGQTAPCMKGIGKTGKLMAMDVSFMLMATSTSETGRMTKPMVSVFTLTKTVPDTKVNGRRINNTEKVLKPGRIRPLMKVIMLRVKSMEPVSSPGLTAVHTKAHSLTITLRDMAAIDGPMIVCSKETGKITKCMETVFSLGQMVVRTKEHT